MGRREGDAEERRQAILDAAEEEFTSVGYSGASIRAIAKRAGVSSALLYWFFENKAKLFAAVLSRRLDKPTSLAFPSEAMDVPPALFLRAFVHIYLAAVSKPEQIKLLRLVLRESEREPELVGALSEMIVTRAISPMRQYLAHHMELGNLRPINPDYAAHALLGMLVSFILRRNILQEPLSQNMDAEEYVDSALDIFLQGMATEQGTKIDTILALDALAGIVPHEPMKPMQRTKIEIEP